MNKKTALLQKKKRNKKEMLLTTQNKIRKQEPNKNHCIFPI